MLEVMERVSRDTVTVRNRFSHELYAIEFHDFQKITDLIHLYHENIYNLPDHERIRAVPLKATHRSNSCLLKVNEIVFV